MSQRPIVFSDLDFTIVFHSEIEDATVHLIDQVRQRARFIIVTARSKRECGHLEDIPNDGLVAENGAAIYIGADGQAELDPEWDTLMATRQETLLAFRDELESRGWLPHRKLHAFSSCIETSGRSEECVLWAQENLPEGLQLHFSRNTAGRYIEVFPVEAGKDTAVRRLSESLGVSVEDTFGMGDNSNDMPMLEVVGMPLAPGNCHPDVRAQVTRRGGYVSPLEGHAGAQDILRQVLAKLND